MAKHPPHQWAAHLVDFGRRRSRRIVALLLATALLLLRWQVVRDLGLSVPVALRNGLAVGLLLDAVVACIAVLVGAVVDGLLPHRARVVLALVVTTVWLTSFANVVYFRFFGVPLDWWIVTQHWSDTYLVRGSARSLGLTLPLVASMAMALAATVFAASCAWREPTLPSQVDGRRVRHAAALGVALSIAFAIWFQQANLERFSSVRLLSDNVLLSWAQQVANPALYAGAGSRWLGSLSDRDPDAATPTRTLAAYRDFSDRDSAERTKSLAAWQSDTLPPYPLARTIDIDTTVSRAMRRRLGLPTSGRIHLVVLFLEGVRAYELQHPELGPVIFPRTRGVLAEHGVSFTQAYSSALSAGQTVRGQFSTLCSMLPNMLGAATYIAHNTVRVHCLQEYLRDQGYSTNWMSAFRSSYQGKRAFETLHGTQRFFDDRYFRSRGVTQTIGDWGQADRPFLQEVVRLLTSMDRLGERVFANVLTISTHHPYSIIAEGPLPPPLAEATRDRADYQGYLSRLRYADSAVGDFFDALFASPIADRTLVVLLGDHSARIEPHLPLNAAQRSDLLFRIPLAFVSKGATPTRIDYPVHQTDVAPTIAQLVGGHGAVNWVGRNLFDGEGSPWLYTTGRGGVSYRTARTACYAGELSLKTACFDVEHRDPLFGGDMPSAVEDTALTRFFARVARANLRAIAFDRVLPPVRSAAPLQR